MGLLDTIADTTRNNTRSLGGLLGLGDSGNGLLSDLDLAKRNALSRLRYNVGKNLENTADYLSGDPNHWMRQPATPEGNAEMDHALMDFGSGMMPGGMAGSTKLVDFNLIKAPAKSNQLSATRKQVNGNRITVANPVDVPKWAGIYDNPADIARNAAQHTEEESPWLQKLFGISRPDLVSMSEERIGNQDPLTNFAAKPKGAKVAANIMTPQNTQRIVDTLSEADKYPNLRAMRGWYMMQPAFDMLEKEFGTEQAIRLYDRFNHFTGMSSPGSDVLSELNRGSAANYLANKDKFDLFFKQGGLADDKRGADYPEELRDVIGHPYHSTSQAAPMKKYLEAGVLDMDSPKVPLYIQSSGVPQTGFQTALPVGDAHWSRGIGLGDVRPWKSVKGERKPNGDSVSNTELQSLGDWYRNQIAGQLGWQSVPTQALQWGAMHQATGVKTPVGATKLELLADQIGQDALRRGIDPRRHALDVLSGQSFIGRGNLKGLLDD